MCSTLSPQLPCANQYVLFWIPGDYFVMIARFRLEFFPGIESTVHQMTQGTKQQSGCPDEVFVPFTVVMQLEFVLCICDTSEPGLSFAQ